MSCVFAVMVIGQSFIDCVNQSRLTVSSKIGSVIASFFVVLLVNMVFKGLNVLQVVCQ